MAYAVVGLVRSHHYAEAKAAIAFQMQAQVGAYESYVGAPYQISVVRYYGDGTEWSDTNADGPNIEFDGFGLFLWELDQYVQASGDTRVARAVVAGREVARRGRAGDAAAVERPHRGAELVDLGGLHWDGQQKHFAYTTITAAKGLCAASRLATAAGDTTDGAGYLAAGQKSRDALLPNLRAADGALVQSTEALAAGSGYLDAAVMEAIGMGLVDPTLHTASATMADIESGLVPASGRGFMRSDAGDAYSSHEWVFVDLRAARALELQGNGSYGTSLFQWNTDQASDNFGELSELHDPTTADYAGQSPMVGFGAGAYLLRLYDRGKPAVRDVRRVRERARERRRRRRRKRRRKRRRATRDRRGHAGARRRRHGHGGGRRRALHRRRRRGPQSGHVARLQRGMRVRPRRRREHRERRARGLAPLASPRIPETAGMSTHLRRSLSV